MVIPFVEMGLEWIAGKEMLAEAWWFACSCAVCPSEGAPLQQDKGARELREVSNEFKGERNE